MRYLGVRAAANELGVHENTIRRWESRGLIRSVRLPGSNFRRFTAEDVEQVRQQMVDTYERHHAMDTLGEVAPVVSASFDPESWDS